MGKEKGCGPLGCLLSIFGIKSGDVDLSVKTEAELTPYERNKAKFYNRHAQEQDSAQAPCPSCRDQMRETEFEGIKYFDCGKCRGIYLKEEALDALGGYEELPDELVNPRVMKVAFYKNPEGQRLCPKCRDKMEVDDLDGISLDVCKFCKGVWLDRGELHKAASLWKARRERQAKRIVCKFCNSPNEFDARACAGCGAPLGSHHE